MVASAGEQPISGGQHATDSASLDATALQRALSPLVPLPQVGTISANGEREIGDLIARAMEKVRPGYSK